MFTRFHPSLLNSGVSHTLQRESPGSLVRDVRKARARIFHVSPSGHSMCFTKPLRWNSYRNADSQRSSPGTKLCFHMLTSLRGKSDQWQDQSPRVCSPFWPTIIKSDRMTTQSQSWSEDGKEAAWEVS